MSHVWLVRVDLGAAPSFGFIILEAPVRNDSLLGYVLTTINGVGDNGCTCIYRGIGCVSDDRHFLLLDQRHRSRDQPRCWHSGYSYEAICGRCHFRGTGLCGDGKI